MTVEAGDPTASIRGMWDFTPDLKIYIEAVHRLRDLGAVFTQVSQGTSQEGFAAEWRLVELVTVGGDQIKRGELFEEADLDAALARFDELHPQTRRLENTAVRVNERFFGYFTVDDWAAIAEIFAAGILYDDRRRVVNGGSWHGRDLVIENMRAVTDFRAENLGFIASRGERLALSRWRWSNSDRAPETFHTEVLCIIEVDTDELIAALIVFDPEDVEAAIAELDARYLAGEAAKHSQTWSAITTAYAALNRHELFATTPDWVNIDHSRLATFTEAADLAKYLSATWELTPQFSIYIEAVHRLSDLGAVYTHVASGTSPEGFEAEWRMVELLTFEGDLINRGEIFDETDLDAALARFDELQPQTPPLENAASRVYERFLACALARNWDVVAEMLADNIFNDDRRRVVNAGLRHGRDATIASMQASAAFGLSAITSTVIATRGERLTLNHERFSIRDQGSDEIVAEVLGIVEIDADERIVTRFAFDLDDIDAAFEELDARYLAGEAAPHADTWSVIAGSCAAFNRHELPAADWVIIDHRRLAPIEASDLPAAIRAIWDLTPDLSTHIEAVHRLSSLGAVVTYNAYGTSPDGFAAEWQMVELLTVEGDRINRFEFFDEDDLDTALARFDELQPQTPRLENAVLERFLAHFAARDWDAMAQDFAEDYYQDDRRRVVNAGVRHGRDTAIEDLRMAEDVGLLTRITSDVIATRGERLILTRFHASGPDPEAIQVVVLQVVEHDADDRIAAVVVFDPDDVDAAIAELEARYLAGEAAPHAQTWSVIAKAHATLNRRELPATTPDWVNIDHRRGIPVAPGDATAYLRASLDAPAGSICVEAVHRLTDLGAVVTWAGQGTSHEGFEAEWRGINVFTVDGDLINRCELFDEADLDAALTHFDELHAHAPRLENAATQVVEHEWACFATRDWAAMAETMTDDFATFDHRRVVNAGVLRGRDAHVANYRAVAEVGFEGIESTVIATRGQRLALIRVWSSTRGFEPGETSTEMIGLVEIDADNRLTAAELFDLEDIDAAFKALDARYLAGEAAVDSQTWSVIAESCAAFNRHELPAADMVTIDRRQLAILKATDPQGFIGTIWDVTPDFRAHIERVHRLNTFGAVASYAAYGTSPEGLDAEWRVIQLLTVEDGRITRCEIFDEEDLATALARFEELHPQGPQLENVASQVEERFRACFAARDWGTMAEILTDDTLMDDRRRVVGVGVRRGRDVQIADLTSAAKLDITSLTESAIATRGQRLVLLRGRFGDRDQRPETFYSELFNVVEIDSDERIVARVMFEDNDIDAAFAELDARYLAGEAGAHAHTWSVVAGAYAAVSRHELPPTTPDWVNIDHRRARAFAPGDLEAYLHAMWDLLTPNTKI